MTKVPRNKGSYHEDRGYWRVKYPLGFSEAKGRYVEYAESVCSEVEAIALIKEINDFVYHGGNPFEIESWRRGKKAEEKAALMTVSQFAAEFMELREKQKKVENRTLESDRSCFKRIEPYIGKALLVEVSVRDIEMALASMRSTGTDNKNGRVYSGTTLQKTYVFLKMMFDKAVDYEYIKKNPMDRVERPKRDTEEKKELTIEEAKALFKAISTQPLSSRPVGVLLCLTCGLRLSEMLALKWSDYKSGMLDINKSLQREKQAYKPTKNKDSRLVPCPLPVVGVLEEWQKIQKAWYKDNKLKWSRDTPIVHSRVGNHVLQRSFTKWFDRAKLTYPIPSDCTMHTLRHSFVTFLDRDCAVDPKTSLVIAGHRTSEAHSIYQHTDIEYLRDAADQIGSLIAPSDDEARCHNCRLWTPSPLDALKGACWAQSTIVVRRALDECRVGGFIRKKGA